MKYRVLRDILNIIYGLNTKTSFAKRFAHRRTHTTLRNHPKKPVLLDRKCSVLIINQRTKEVDNYSPPNIPESGPSTRIRKQRNSVYCSSTATLSARSNCLSVIFLSSKWVRRFDRLFTRFDTFHSTLPALVSTHRLSDGRDHRLSISIIAVNKIDSVRLPYSQVRVSCSLTCMEVWQCRTELVVKVSQCVFVCQWMHASPVNSGALDVVRFFRRGQWNLKLFSFLKGF